MPPPLEHKLWTAGANLPLISECSCFSLHPLLMPSSPWITTRRLPGLLTSAQAPSICTKPSGQNTIFITEVMQLALPLPYGHCHCDVVSIAHVSAGITSLHGSVPMTCPMSFLLLCYSATPNSSGLLAVPRMLQARHALAQSLCTGSSLCLEFSPSGHLCGLCLLMPQVWLK